MEKKLAVVESIIPAINSVTSSSMSEKPLAQLAVI